MSFIMNYIISFILSFILKYRINFFSRALAILSLGNSIFAFTFTSIATVTVTVTATATLTLTAILTVFVTTVTPLAATAQMAAKKPTQRPLPKKEIPLSGFVPSDFKRVDPHGPPRSSAKQESLINKDAYSFDRACEVCHVGGQMHPSSNAASESCLNCHNQYPHSGVAEHSKKNMTCTSCHSFHRFDSIPWAQASGQFSSFKTKALAPGEVMHPATQPILKKNCTDCHKW